MSSIKEVEMKNETNSSVEKNDANNNALAAANFDTRNGTSRTKINDTKAGMENIDKERINAIILKSSKS